MTISDNTAPAQSLKDWLSEKLPFILLLPSLIGSFIYVVGFTAWTFYLSLSNSAQLPSYGWVGFSNYSKLFANARWAISYNNLFFFSGLYIIGTIAVGLLLATLIDQRIRGESAWRTIFLYPLAVSFVVTGTVWSWLFNPTVGFENLVHQLGWANFKFALTIDRKYAIWAIIITGIWQASGFAMALFLAGLRSVDPDLIKAAQIDGASTFRTYYKVIIPAIAPIFVAVIVIMLQFAIKTFELVTTLTQGGPGISTSFPASYVYDFMFTRGQINLGAAASMMMLLMLAMVLVPYALYKIWRERWMAGNG